ncbi:743_t:CDS:2 [Entrophospora sp. SA101]|nr:743_t:CDS:2 [Entrophospora sp. SA101]
MVHRLSLAGENADDTEALQEKFKSFNKNTKCVANDEVCIGKDFAQCVTTIENGKTVDKFVTTSCSGSGLECVILPLVLKSRGKTTAGNNPSKRSPKESTPNDMDKIRKLNADDAVVNGSVKPRFSLQFCAAGLKCFVLPLVNSRGISITHTEEDRANCFKKARDQN